MKIINLWLFIVSFVLGSPISILAAESTQYSSAYQSSFDDYQSLSDESLSDWKSINVPSNKSGHSGHSMAGMQHKMTPEQMANMSSDEKAMPDMEGMDNGNMSSMDSNSMKGMDHSQTMKNQAKSSMAGMDHSQMTGMDHGNMKSNSQPAMRDMKMEDMPGMSHDEMPAHEHGSHEMKDMDHSHMGDSKSSEMHSRDESEPHEHSVDQEEHTNKTTSTIPTIQTDSRLILPNYHPAIVHFPIALTIISFLLSLGSYVKRDHPVSSQLAAAGHFTLWIAAISAGIAVLFGWLAYNSVNHDDAGHAAMLLHRSWAVPTAIGLILLAGWDAWKYRVNELISVPMLLLLFLLSQSIAITGWLGGELVYRHGIGVLSLPASEGTGHSHHHEHGATETHTDDTHVDESETSAHHHDAEVGEPNEH